MLFAYNTYYHIRDDRTTWEERIRNHLHLPALFKRMILRIEEIRLKMVEERN